jgi:uncharacterized protein (TIGR02271 family)
MAMTERSTVVGVFEDRDEAERAVDELRRSGFDEDQIGFATRGGDAPEGGSDIRAGESHAGEGAAGGIVTGGLIGGLLGALAAGLIPGIGPVIAGGLLAGILGGAAVGAAAGGLIGALMGMGVPEDEARYYDEEFRAGRTLVTVKADGRYQEAAAILRRRGAYDVESRDAGVSPRTGSAAAGRARMDEDERTLELREEELRARKEMVEAGEVGLHKEVVSEQKTMDVPVTREEAYVERRPVDRQPADRPIGEGETIKVPLREERVEVEKRPVVYEEVEVGKRPVQETRQVSDTVRREEVRLDREGDATVRGGGMGVTGLRSWDEVGPRHRQEWEQRYGGSGRRWADVEPYRRYGYEMAHEDRYRDRDWAAVESNLRTDYADWSRRRGYSHDEDAWDRLKDEVRDAWEGARTAARRR